MEGDQCSGRDRKFGVIAGASTGDTADPEPLRDSPQRFARIGSYKRPDGGVIP